ncbi:MAG: winged helix-turn-helix transcriptional regulator, partial [Anaerolineae bacterium]|nr:winged helix-turn-helix transcriptional regulator [Anaerolineae bacterium]
MDSPLRDEIALVHSRFCSGLADPTRILIIYALAERSWNVTELADHLDVAQPVISRHLNILRERGIVVAEREGRNVGYQLADDRIVEALNLFRSIIADQLHAQEQLVQFAAIED